MQTPHSHPSQSVRTSTLYFYQYLPQPRFMAANAPDDEDEGIGELIVSEVIRLVEEEIQRYIATLQNQREPAQEGNDCKLCPCRKFPRRDRLLQHVQKYHCKDRLFTANGRSQAQWNILLALFEQEQAG